MSASDEQAPKNQHLIELINEHLVSKYGEKRRLFSLISAFSVAAVVASFAVLLVNHRGQANQNELALGELRAEIDDSTYARRLSSAYEQYNQQLKLSKEKISYQKNKIDNTKSHNLGDYNLDDYNPNSSMSGSMSGSMGGSMQSTPLGMRRKDVKTRELIENQQKEIARQRQVIAAGERKFISVRHVLLANEKELYFTTNSLRMYTTYYDSLRELNSLTMRRQDSLSKQLLAYKRKAQRYDSITTLIKRLQPNAAGIER